MPTLGRGLPRLASSWWQPGSTEEALSVGLCLPESILRVATLYGGSSALSATGQNPVYGNKPGVSALEKAIKTLPEEHGCRLESNQSVIPTCRSIYARQMSRHHNGFNHDHIDEPPKKARACARVRPTWRFLKGTNQTRLSAVPVFNSCKRFCRPTKPTD